MARIKDQAICIRHREWSETSQVVWLLCEQHGKVRGLAKGSRKTSPSSIARFSGGIDLLTRGQVMFVTKPTAELATITEWDLQKPHRHFRTDLRSQHLGLYAADLANAFLADHDPHPVAFAALARVLGELGDPARHEGAVLRYQWDLLQDAGFRPELHQDAQTGGRLADRETYTFDAEAGGLTEAPGTVRAKNSSWRVRRQTVQVLRALGDNPDTESESGSVPTAEARDAVVRANRLLCVYARTKLDRELPTMQFLLKGP